MPEIKPMKTIKFAGADGPTEQVQTQKKDVTEVDPTKIEFNKELKTVLFVIRDKGGCGFYRCVQPASFLRTMGLMNTITDFKTTTREHIIQADLVVFQETGSSASIEAMNFAIENKKPVVVECDDFLYKVSPNNEGGYGAWNPGTLFIHRFTKQVLAASAVTVSTPQLARELFTRNKNIYVLPNFLNESNWEQQLTKKSDGYIRIGWAGGNAHIDDLKMISKVIEKIVREYKGKIKFETMGMVKHELKGVFDGLEEFHDNCPQCGYQGDSVTWMGESIDNYPVVLASHGWDIALAPVVNESFGNCKSDLKLREYSAIGYPIVASDVVPYSEAKDDGCDVLLAKSFDEWYNHIKDLVENPKKRQDIVRRNKNWISSKWIADNINLYHDAYMQIIQRYERLNNIKK